MSEFSAQNTVNEVVSNLDATLNTVLDAQRRAFMRDGTPSLEIRLGRLERCMTMIKENQGALCDAVNADFGNRVDEMTRAADFFTSSLPGQIHQEAPEKVDEASETAPRLSLQPDWRQGLPLLSASGSRGYSEPVE